MAVAQTACATGLMQGATSAWLGYALALYSLHKGDAKGLAQHALEKGMSASTAPQVVLNSLAESCCAIMHTMSPHSWHFASVDPLAAIMAGFTHLQQHLESKHRLDSGFVTRLASLSCMDDKHWLCAH